MSQISAQIRHYFLVFSLPFSHDVTILVHTKPFDGIPDRSLEGFNGVLVQYKELA